MLTVINPDNSNDVQHIDFSNILSLKECNSGSIVSFRAKRGVKKNFLSNLTIDNIRELIVSNKVTLSPIFRSFEYRMNPVISLLREEDNTAHKRMCAQCGVIDQVYHNRSCNCSIFKEFDGSLKNNTLSKQHVCINKDELELSNIDIDKIKFNRYDQFEKEMTVKNISFDGDYAKGTIKLAGQEIIVHSDEFSDGSISAKRAYWFLK